MRTFFEPQGILVIGVSEAPDNLGQRVVDNLRRWSYQDASWPWAAAPARSPEIREIDVNPIVVGPGGPRAVDARVVTI